MKKHVFIGIALGMAACTSPRVEWVSTTPEDCYRQQPAIHLTDVDAADVTVFTDKTLQTVDGFGGCFNEWGWVTLSALNEADRTAVIRDLFGEEGMNFTLGRLPVGANDFARDWYSYNETEGDFEMAHFRIDNDRETLIPFIHAAQQVNPGIRLWASPWSPPAWMKYNKHYACRPRPAVNDLPGSPDQDLEGTNMFIQSPEYFQAYALYFRKFIEAYRAEGIPVGMVAPQNEFNSCQIFPSCTWTAAGLETFVGEYLGPQMQELGVEIMLGTMERANHLLADTLMQGKSGRYISAVGFQWAGKNAIATIHETYPEMKLIQSESECGDGQNSWEYCFYIAGLMKHYFDRGIASYMYWNISLDSDAANNRWKWPQNSLISVDRQAKTFRYNPEYYLMKHYSHFVKPGAKRLETAGKDAGLLAFANPDGSVALVAFNREDAPQPLKIAVGNRMLSVDLKPKSINTLRIEN
jgi:glucosylceramidase